MRSPSELKCQGRNEIVIASLKPRIKKKLIRKKTWQNLRKALQETSFGRPLSGIMPRFSHLLKVMVVPSVAFQMNYKLAGRKHTHTQVKTVPSVCSPGLWHLSEVGCPSGQQLSSVPWKWGSNSQSSPHDTCTKSPSQIDITVKQAQKLSGPHPSL